MNNEEKILALLEQMNARQDRTEEILGQMNESISDLKDGQTRLDRNNATMEKEINRISSTQDYMRAAQRNTESSLAVIERGVSRLEKDVGGLMADVSEIKEHQTTLEDKVGELMDDMRFVRETATRIEHKQGQQIRALEDGQVVLESRLDDHDAQLRKLAQ